MYNIVCLTCSVRILTLLSNSGKVGCSAALKVANVVSVPQLVHVRLRASVAKNKADRQLLAMLDIVTVDCSSHDSYHLVLFIDSIHAVP